MRPFQELWEDFKAGLPLSDAERMFIAEGCEFAAAFVFSNIADLMEGRDDDPDNDLFDHEWAAYLNACAILGEEPEWELKLDE